MPALLVVVGGLVCQMGVGSNYLFGALAPDIVADFGWTKTQFAGARAPQLWVMALSSPLVGYLAVRFGPRSVLLVSMVLLGLAFLLLSRLGSLWQLYLLLSLQALATTGLGDVTVGQMVAQWFDRGRGLALGLVYTGSNLGGTILVGSMGLLAASGEWRDVLDRVGWVAFLVLLPVAALTVRAPARSVAETPEEEEASEAALSLREALRTRSFWILAVTLFTFFFYFIAILDHLVFFLREQGFSPGDARGYLAQAIFLGMASKIGFGWIADRLTPWRAAFLDFGLLASSSVFLLFPPGPISISVFVTLFGFATAARDVVYPMIIAYCFGRRFLAQIYGAMMLVLPAGALGAWYAATVSDRSGSYGEAFLTFVVINVVACGALFFLRDEVDRPQGGPDQEANVPAS